MEDFWIDSWNQNKLIKQINILRQPVTLSGEVVHLNKFLSEPVALPGENVPIKKTITGKLSNPFN